MINEEKEKFYNRAVNMFGYINRVISNADCVA
jgi:hypothetical protein